MEELVSLGESMICYKGSHWKLNSPSARALGFPDSEDGLPSSTVDSILNNTASIHVSPESTHVPSMLLDVRKGQPIEVEVILGEVVRMAKERGVSVPVGIIHKNSHES